MSLKVPVALAGRLQQHQCEHQGSKRPHTAPVQETEKNISGFQGLAVPEFSHFGLAVPEFSHFAPNDTKYRSACKDTGCRNERLNTLQNVLLSDLAAT
jgi:hypothetical protein